MRMSQCLPLSFATLAALALPAAAQSQVTISGYLDTGVFRDYDKTRKLGRSSAAIWRWPARKTWAVASRPTSA